MSSYKINTKCVQGGYTPGNGEPRQIPIVQSTTFKYATSEDMAKLFDLEASGYFYTRLQNPTNDHVAAKICDMEGGTAAMLTSSGQAANFYAVFNIANCGDHVVASSTIYGGTYNYLAHTFPLNNQVTTTFADPYVEGSFEAAIQENTKAIFVETLGNPNSNVIDLEDLARIAHKHNIPLVVDSTFATPYLIRPIEYGADIVIHSATKFIGGHGTAIGGVIIDGGTFDWKAAGAYPWISEANPSYHGVAFTDAAGPAAFATYIRAVILRDTGATLSPFHAFLFLQGLETLSLRVERHVSNALQIVNYLNNHPQVEAVHHPSLPTEPTHELYKKYLPKGGGSIFTFEIKGDAKTAQAFIDNLAIFSLLANVADVKSLVIHPATTTHSQCTKEELLEQDIKPNTIRLSVGIEKAEDLIAALEGAFEAVR